MRRHASPHHVPLGILVFAAGVLACSTMEAKLPAPGDAVALGTWGGDTAGLIVGDTAAHLHIGCTFGDVTGRIALDAAGRFSMTGTYVLRAFPVLVGPVLPAQFEGRVSGSSLTVTVTVTDTVQHATVVRGPVTVQFEVEPLMGNCPICRKHY